MVQISSTQAIFLPDLLMENCGNLTDLALEVVKDFQHATPGRLFRLVSATAIHVPLQVRFEAHSLSGCCHTIGAEALGTLFEQIERAAKQSDLSNAPTLLAEVEHQMPLLNDALTKYVQNSD